MKTWIFLAAILATAVSCRKDPAPDPEPEPEPRIRFRFQFDSTQARLDNLGNPSMVPAGHDAQSPRFNSMSAHYIELTPGQFTALGNGEVLYHAPETTAGGANAIDFSQSTVVGEGVDFFSMPIKDLTPGTYEYLRVSLAYQNYDITFRYNSLVLDGTLASFIGYNTYIGTYNVNTQPVTVNDDKLQGYWGFEWYVLGNHYTATGQAPPGATTVPNPLFATSPIPAGSCVVTAAFGAPLVITGNETEDIIITVSLSTNYSFEWEDDDMDGYYDPAAGDTVVDMGIRGMLLYVD
jgi:hypothetical protein